MGNPGAFPPTPPPPTYPDVYTSLDPLNGDDVITTDMSSVTITGTTDAVGATGVVTYLFPYLENDGQAERASNFIARSALAAITDLGTTDSDGKELGTYSNILPTAGLAPGLYVAESFVNFGTDANPILESAKPQGTQIFSVAPTDEQTTPVELAATSGEISTDGRYLLYTAINEYNEPEKTGDVYERDLQTGAEVDLTLTGAQPIGTFAISHTYTIEPGTDYLTYPSFTSANGRYTFGTIHDFDLNPDGGGYDPLPVVTDNATGDQSVVGHTGAYHVAVGAAIAASDDGDTVLSESDFQVQYGRIGESNVIQADPVVFVSYLNPAPALTIDPVNGTNRFSPGAASVTVTGTSDAIGQSVEIDFVLPGAAVATAIVQADGSWSYSFDPAGIPYNALFIEASVVSAGGTPAHVSENVEISNEAPPALTSIVAMTKENQNTFGPTETLTIRLNTNEAVYVTGTPTLTLSNGEVATYSAGSGTDQIDFTYVPSITDPGSADIGVTGLALPAGAFIGDADGNALVGPFTQALGIALLTVPSIASLDPVAFTSDFLTNSNTPGIVVGAETGETVTIYDNGVAIGTGITPTYGIQGITYVEIHATSPLPEGQSTLTAAAIDSSGRSSALSAPITITVDTIPPAEHIIDLAVNTTDNVDLTDQADLAVSITGRLNAPLQDGDSVVITLPDGQTQVVIPPDEITGFSLALTPFQAESFGAGGIVTATVEDAAGNVSATVTQAFTADTVRSITLVSADPTHPLSSEELDPSLSGNGQFVAFLAEPGGGFADASVSASSSAGAAGIDIEDLATGMVTQAVANNAAGDPALSSDGTMLAFDENGISGEQIYVANLATGAVTLVSAADTSATTPADADSLSPGISADGNSIAFASTADNLLPGVGANQLYVATIAGGTITGLVAASVSASGTIGNGYSYNPSLAGDGSEVAFESTDTNLLAANDPHTANLNANNGQIYVKALVNNAASGLVAGEVVLVGGAASGVVGDGNSASAVLSADGRYVVFTSAADNLAPANLSPGATLPTGITQIYVEDLLTGKISLVSQAPNGIIGDYTAGTAAISADGSTIVFSDQSDNLLPGVNGGQVYAAHLSEGEVTSLTVLSEPGAIPGDNASIAVSVSADGDTTAFESAADNLVPGTGGNLVSHVYATSNSQPVATAPPVTLTVTNTDDSGAGSLRAALAAATDGDTIDFATDLAGGTITLASSLLIGETVTLDGLGENITVSGNHAVTDIDVVIPADGEAVIEGLTIADGKGQGTVGATGSTYVGPAGNPSAGGIDLQGGALTLLHDSFAGNTATGGDGTGDYYQYGGAAGQAAGAILVGDGTSLSAANLSFTDNTATGGTGGGGDDKGTGGLGGAAAGAIYLARGARASLADLTFNGNAATGGAGGNNAHKGGGGDGAAAGGAIYIDNQAMVSNAGTTFSNDSFTDNTATGGKGGHGDDTGVGPKAAGYGGGGAGAIYVDSQTLLTPVDFTYDGNTASAGLNGDGSAGPAVSADTNIPTSTGTQPEGTSAEDGYIVGGTVSYVNGSGSPATTDSDGGFTLAGGTGPIMLTGGVDSATGLPFTGLLTAPAGATVLSPLTTLVEAVAEARGDTSAAGITAANALVLGAFPLPSGIDLTRFDAEGTLFDGTPTEIGPAGLVFAADNYIESLERLIDAAGGSVPSVIATIAQQLAAGQTVDLVEPATLLADGGLPSAAATAIVDIATATLNAVEAQIDGQGSQALFAYVSGGSIAAQQDGAAALASAAQIGTDAAFEQAATTYVSDLPETLAAADDMVTACYRRGTRIMTTRGAVPIEHLAIGDQACIASGGSRAIVWLGHRRIDLARHAAPADVWPILVEAGAFAPDLPARDLWLSPGHNIAIHDVLIPISALQNGRTIRQVATRNVEYWHVELDSHDIILAEGLPAESYLDTGNRGAFANGGVFIDLYPDFKPRHWAETVLPLALDGAPVTRAKASLLARAAALGETICEDGDIHILADGRRFEPLERHQQSLEFHLPAGCRSITLTSRHFVPSHIDPASEDQRALGICVGGLRLDGVEIELDQSSIFGKGWHYFEPLPGGVGQRWTAGRAVLPRHTLQVVVQLSGRGFYWAPRRQKALRTSVM